jgi:hypothetical protein
MSDSSYTATSNNKQLNPKIKLWYPITAAYEDATYSVTMKAPEHDNSKKVARNQSIIRTRAGKTIVYDRGNNLNSILALKFKDIPDVDRASLVIFLEAVQWASSKIAYQDMYGDIYYGRAVEENGITYRDQGFVDKQTKKPSRILWDFDLDILDLTGNIEELDEEDPPVSTALGLHLADFDEPHNPTICTTVNIADGAKLIEQFKTVDWKSVSWLIVASKGARKVTLAVVLVHDRDGVTDATAVADPYLEFFNEIGDIYSKLTFTSAITGAGGSQYMQLKCASSEDGINVCVKRVKL